MIKIPRTMSTQHPDNVNNPFFTENGLLGGEDEVQEAFYAFSHLGCTEQMWDFEGKEVDNFVVKKLLTRNESFFTEKKLGRDVFLTFRVPNPEVERAEAKILLETLEAIPRSFDAARVFYGEDIAPIFEIILPMTTSAKSLDRIYHYYVDTVVGKQKHFLKEGDITIGEWIGEFKPEKINVIPLLEDKINMLNASDIVREYLKDKQVEYQRVFLARSDPAVNYGQIGAVLLNKIALWRLHKLSEELHVPIYPILGVGSAPFRGNMRPQTVAGILRGYPSVQTFTIQSSFKFDNAPELVQEAVRKINETERQAPMEVDEERAIAIIEKYEAEYLKQVIRLAPAINHVALYVPKRRKRKLHIGLFGYSRSLGDIKLPRAITFTAALYSLGVPPELLGLNVLSKDDLLYIETVYPNIKNDLRDAAKFANVESPFFPAEIRSHVLDLVDDAAIDVEHKKLTSSIAKNILEQTSEGTGELLLRAAHRRGFLG